MKVSDHISCSFFVYWHLWYLSFIAQEGDAYQLPLPVFSASVATATAVASARTTGTTAPEVPASTAAPVSRMLMRGSSVGAFRGSLESSVKTTSTSASTFPVLTAPPASTWSTTSAAHAHRAFPVATVATTATSLPARLLHAAAERPALTNRRVSSVSAPPVTTVTVAKKPASRFRC